MNQLVTDIWPFLMTGLIGVIGWQWKESHAIKIRVAVMEKTIDDLLKTVDHVQKRQDSHSKKQDEIVNLITELKVEVVRQIGNMTTELGVLSADVKNINRVLSVNDDGIKFKTKNNR